MTEEEFRSQDKRETATIREVYERCLDGKFYEDYDFASGPGLRALKTAAEAEDAKQFDYVSEATLTLSNQFHGELVGRGIFERRLSLAIHALAELDEVKKTLFYGKDNGLQQLSTHKDCSSLAVDMCGDNGPTNETALKMEQIIHGIIGLATEAGELLELLQATLEGKPFDPVNLKEEVGDGKWYMAILAKAAGFAWGDDERVNIQKLRKRFPNAFTEFDANNRDLTSERAILERGNIEFVNDDKTGNIEFRAPLPDIVGIQSYGTLDTGFSRSPIADSDGTDGA